MSLGMGKNEDLMTAVRKGDLSAVTKLLGKSHSSKPKLMGSCKKLNVNQVDASGYAPLHQAAMNGSVDVTRALLEYGAGVDVIDSKGLRPIHFAIEGGHADVVATLLQRGSRVDDPSYDGTTPLHVACERGHTEIVELLLAHDADPTLYNGSHKTALDIACEFGFEQIVGLLLDGTNGRCQQHLLMRDADASGNIQGTSCLHLAARNGHTSIVSRLLDAGCDINRRTREGTCLHEAVANGHIEIVSLLLNRGVDITCVNAHKQTAVDIICRMPASRANVQLRQLLQKAASQLYSTPQLITPGDDCDPRYVDGYGNTNCGQVVADQHFRYDPVDKAVSAKNITGVGATGYVTDALRCTPTPLHRPSDPAGMSHSPGSPGIRGAPRSPAPHFVVAPIRSSSDLSHDCGSIVLHAQFDSAPPSLVSSRIEPSSVVTHRRQMIPRSRSPVDQILPADEVGDRTRLGCGTDSPGSSGSSCSSGFTGNPCHAAGGLPPSLARQQHRLSGHSYESGVASLTSSRHSYLSVASSSSHGSLNRLAEDEESAYASIINFSELYENGFSESEIMRAWLSEIHLEDYFGLFDSAGYDMPTISRMTPEDLTAVGITQPAVRKKLSSEIGKLRIDDGIPNYIPNDLMEWLQMLRLDEYHDAIVNDGCYADINSVTDITWEDLEEIGIKKLGHQKKIMLAINRLKKLKSSRRSDQANNELYRVGSGYVDSASVQLSQGGYLQNPTCYQMKTTSRENVSALATSPGYLTSSCEPSRVREIIHVQREQSPALCRPEVVAIHVRRSTPVSGLSSLDTPTATGAVYESFHSTPTNDCATFVNRTDEHVMSMSDDGAGWSREAETSQQGTSFRTRRASGGPLSSAPPVGNGGFFCRGSQLSGVYPKHEMHSSTGHGSAPSTPLRGSITSGGMARKIPPPPPRRTNSIKVDSVSSGLSKRSNDTEVIDSTGNLQQTELPGLMATSDIGPAPANSTDSDDGDFQQQFETLKRKTDKRPTTVTVEQGGPGDCGTLPFANENVGTIRPRGPSHSSKNVSKPVDHLDDDEDDDDDFDTGTVRRRVGIKKISPNPYNANAVRTEDDEVEALNKLTSEVGESSHIFSDIGNLFDGLTHELEELLTQPL